MPSKSKNANATPTSWPEAPSSGARRSGHSNNGAGKGLRLDKHHGKLMGVCSGLANWTGMNVNLLRILFVLATIFGFGSAIVIYFAIGLIVD